MGRRPGRWAARAPWGRLAWIAASVGLVGGGCDRAVRQPAASEVAARWEHRFTPTAALDRMDAEICFHGRVPPLLEPQTARVRDVIADIERVHQGTVSPLAMGERGVELTAVTPGDCVRYTVDLAAVTTADVLAYRRRASGWRYGGDLMLSPDYYLLRPTGPLEDVTLTAYFELPPGVNVLVPWPRLDAAAAAAAQAGTTAPAAAPAADTAGPYRIPTTSFNWRIHGALGRFDIDVIEVAGARLRVVMLGNDWQVERRLVLDWLSEAATAVAGLYHGFPEPEAQIIVVPSPGGRVAHGNAAQGGGPSITLMVGTEITATAMRADWVAVHELLHLGMPTVDNSARWLTEGMATYYEPLLRARAGWITPQQAWEILHDGFERGSARGSGRTLAEESRDMNKSHEYWRVYWAGAAIAMIADVTLRGHADAPTLDDQMRAIRACCLHSTRTWSAEALLDAIGAPGPASDPVPDLASLARGYPGQEAFPDLAATYAALGLRFDAQGRLRDTPGALSAEARALRAALIDRSPRSPSSPRLPDSRTGSDVRSVLAPASAPAPAAGPAARAHHSGR